MLLTRVLIQDSWAKTPVSPFKIGGFWDFGNGLKIISWPFHPGVAEPWIILTKPRHSNHILGTLSLRADQPDLLSATG
ncbi:hypothetical protein OBB02_00620, partial [Candidatus Puniceispirillum sp.]|nr:hypothetical protein [Candidatus Puniceispirillum sp.]